MTLPDAIRFAAIHHGDTLDYGKQPFIGHPLRVMASVAASQLPVNGLILAATVLHDVIEDTDVVSDDLRDAGFPKYVVEIVNVLTRRSDDKYEDYIRKIKDFGYPAVNIKICDIKDNLNPARSLPGLNLSKRYIQALKVLEK